MKIVYRSLYPVGYEEVKVSDNYQAVVPFTEIKPLAIEYTQSQFFDWSENRWKEAYTQDVSKQLEMLTIVNNTLQNQTTELIKNAEKQAQEMLDTQLALADVYELLVGGETIG
ncbi:hypothetical protein GIX45_28275 [Erwinia sp. CPCC 100877]|nr:hypothetical protein [Erwinia sp. CPCC 100877]